jgi:hypothetical protein
MGAVRLEQRLALLVLAGGVVGDAGDDHWGAFVIVGRHWRNMIEADNSINKRTFPGPPALARLEIMTFLP